jgi:23S rRNA (pseudouridine1915-N3)-methyltransferase
VKVHLSRVGKGRLAWADAAAADYTRRLKRYAPFEEVLIRPSGADAEADRLLKRVRPGDRLIVFDERGEALSSEGWAAALGGAMDRGVGTLWFAIGGADGHAPVVRQRADEVWRLAPMVLAHQVARVVALEQLYRAWTILGGEPYHRS